MQKAFQLITVPVALDDIVITDEDTSVTFDVLANDSDANLDTLGVAGVTQGYQRKRGYQSRQYGHIHA